MPCLAGPRKMWPSYKWSLSVVKSFSASHHDKEVYTIIFFFSSNRKISQHSFYPICIQPAWSFSTSLATLKQLLLGLLYNAHIFLEYLCLNFKCFTSPDLRTRVVQKHSPRKHRGSADTGMECGNTRTSADPEHQPPICLHVQFSLKEASIREKIHWVENTFCKCGLQELLILKKKKMRKMPKLYWSKDQYFPNNFLNQ